MLIDLHAHTSGISRCCRIPYKEVIARAKEAGIDGLVLTNHYQKDYAKDGDYAAFAKRYVEEYHIMKAYADEIGYTLFYGVEVTMERYPAVHLLIYGAPEDLVINYPTLFELTQQELYKLVKDNNGIVVQAHPYRKDVDRLLDVNYLDGIEINCHPLYEDTHLAKLADVTTNAGLMLTCGGDFHADTHRPHCGIYLPSDIDSVEGIANYILTTDRVKLCVQETREMTSHDVEYVRGVGIV